MDTLDVWGEAAVVYFKYQEDYERALWIQNNCKDGGFYRNSLLILLNKNDIRNAVFYQDVIGSVVENEVKYDKGSFIGERAAWYFADEAHRNAITGWFGLLKGLGLVSRAAKAAIGSAALIAGPAELAREASVDAVAKIRNELAKRLRIEEAKCPCTVAENVGTVSRFLPGGSLTVSEQAGGHVLARHVGQTEEQLAARLSAQAEITTASTFTTRAQAESAISSALEANATKITEWTSKGASGRLTVDAAYSGGNVLTRGASTSTQGTGVRVILQGNGQGDYHILTGYPTK